MRKAGGFASGRRRLTSKRGRHAADRLVAHTPHLPHGMHRDRLRDAIRAAPGHLPRDVKSVHLHVPERVADVPRPHLEFSRPSARKNERGFRAQHCLPYLFAFLIGATLMYLMDPSAGRRRRALTKDKSRSFARRSAHQAEHAARGVRAEAQSLAAKASHPRFTQHEPDNDVTLQRKVESELFRDRWVPKGDLNLSVQNRTVVLRGQVDNEDQIAEIERRVRRVVGVHGIENLMHLPGQPAPNKLEALEAQHQAEQIIASGRASGERGAG